MLRFIQRGTLIRFASFCFLVPAVVGAQGLDTAKLDEILGRPGQKMGEVHRFGFPRTDLHVTLHGVAIKPGLALAGC
jgi:hypothetical protein